MKKNYKDKLTKFGIITISTAVLTTVILPSISFAQTSTEDIVTLPSKDVILVENHEVEIEGKDYTIDTVIHDGNIINSVLDESGTVTFTKNMQTNIITVTSDFLTEYEIILMESDVNQVVEDELITNYIPSSSINSGFTTMAQKGNWAWSGWSNKSVTPNGKATVQIIVGILGSGFGFYGAAATGIANIWLQYNLKTGYFTVRQGSRLDTDPNYYWVKKDTKFYKESSRKTLLKQAMSTPQRYFLHY